MEEISVSLISQNTYTYPEHRKIWKKLMGYYFYCFNLKKIKSRFSRFTWCVLPAYVYVHRAPRQYLWGTEKGATFPGTGVTAVSALPRGSSESNLGPLQEQSVPLTIKPSLLLLKSSYYFLKHLFCICVLKYDNIDLQHLTSNIISIDVTWRE